MLQTGLGQIEAVVLALEQTRPGVAAHCRRVSAYAVRLATQLGLSPQDLETVRLGALLHDVGKMLVPSRILDKPGRPTGREWQELKLHPQLGSEIAHRSGFDDEVCAIVLYHHERWDGRGYPDGLNERAVHYLARIVAVMDTYDALTSSRLYRDRLAPEAARATIARSSGTKFCPWITSAFLAMPADAMWHPEAQVPAGEGHPEGLVPVSVWESNGLWPLSAAPRELCHC